MLLFDVFTVRYTERSTYCDICVYCRNIRNLDKNGNPNLLSDLFRKGGDLFSTSQILNEIVISSQSFWFPCCHFPSLPFPFICTESNSWNATKKKQYRRDMKYTGLLSYTSQLLISSFWSYVRSIFYKRCYNLKK